MPTSFKSAFNRERGVNYQDGIQRTGENFSPQWLKKSCLSFLVIPLIGGGYAVYEMIFKGAGREHFPMICGGTLGLLAVGIGTAIKNALKKK